MTLILVYCCCGSLPEEDLSRKKIEFRFKERLDSSLKPEMTFSFLDL